MPKPAPTPEKTSTAPQLRKAGSQSAAQQSTGGPSHLVGDDGTDLPAQHAAGVQALAGARPHNANKALEHGLDHGHEPPVGETAEPVAPFVTASTLSESNASAKLGPGVPPAGHNPNNGPLDRVRSDAGGRALTTNQGVRIGDNQNTLKAGLRGPALLEDFILREKITHFDHERIPERVVHARGSGAHGYFECTRAIPELTRAAPFQADGQQTPVFVRFSTVAGERGSIDTARDVRGFAVKFYTNEGNWDLVGNNMPVFFIQDAMKFPDLVHAVKPEPHHGMPQAASAHDTFWDFVSLMPESTHMLMWAMSDRAIPRSYRMMQGFGVHTWRLVNAAGESVFVKFHWKPLLGTHSLVWDEAVKLAGADPDFHRRDLREAIEAGEYPEWELSLQVFTEEQAEQFSFDVLDATKLVPEELVPLQSVGRMVLNRNPDNFFAETEQVAFCVAHVVPGIDFTHDPLLAGRIHSYVDTQISRLGGPNFHEIPINAPIAQVHNNQRDGMHRQALHRGRVAYEPNSLGGGCPFQAGRQGFVSFPQPVEQDKMRGKPEKFAEHYNQATLFYDSQTETEKRHIAAAFRFELSKLTVPAIRERMLASLANVSGRLAAEVAEGLGMDVPPPLPRAIEVPPEPEVRQSPALSLTALPGERGIRSRKVAILVADGFEAELPAAVAAALLETGATSRYVGPHVGRTRTAAGQAIEADASLENSPSVLFDAVVLPGGEAAVQALRADPHTLPFIRDAWLHGKTILSIGASSALLGAAGVVATLASGEPDPGISQVGPQDAAQACAWLVEAMGRHRHPEREAALPA
ncbi:catalase [Ideonella sp.]|uniref:catalase n=1 Tax=Ideonella sp. TaxID=1929293 RepID=UPI0035B246C0